jgi:aerobic C4-dicarboxylate transport protein
VTAIAEAPPRRPIVTQLWFQVLAATAVGIVLGWLRPGLGVELKPLGDAFIALLRMMIGPVIFCTVVHGIGGMSDLRRVGRVAIRAIVYFEIITLLALVVALIAVDLWQPGAGMHVDPRSLDASGVAKGQAPAGIGAFLLHLIPETFVSAFTQRDALQVLVVAVLFGFGLSLAGERGRPVQALIASLSEIVFRIVGFIMWAAPLGAFGAIAFTVGRFGTGSLVSLGRLIVEFYAVSALFVFLVLGGVAWLAGVSLLRLLSHIRDELVIVAATTSTEAVLPRVIEKMRAAGCEEGVVGLVVPTGYSFNLDGTCLYLVTVVLFLAQATDTPLDLGQQLTVIAILLLTSKGAAGVAGAALVVLSATLSSLGTVPVVSVALVVGIHRLLAEALTFVNLVGYCVATVVVARWENAVDPRLLAETIGRRRVE